MSPSGPSAPGLAARDRMRALSRRLNELEAEHRRLLASATVARVQELEAQVARLERQARYADRLTAVVERQRAALLVAKVLHRGDEAGEAMRETDAALAERRAG